jgi:hypothetical protein
MRSVLAAVLLFPAMLSAQAVHSGVSHLVASVDAPAFGFQASAVKAAVPTAMPALIAPVRLSEIKLAPTAAIAASNTITVEYTVDATGTPQNIKVDQPLDASSTARVISAVQAVRYTPAQLHGQAIAAPVVLHMELVK